MKDFWFFFSLSLAYLELNYDGRYFRTYLYPLLIYCLSTPNPPFLLYNTGAMTDSNSRDAGGSLQGLMS
jgi:hypothetical protein